jgi:hypothetical protein
MIYHQDQLGAKLQSDDLYAFREWSKIGSTTLVKNIAARAFSIRIYSFGYVAEDWTTHAPCRRSPIPVGAASAAINALIAATPANTPRPAATPAPTGKGTELSIESIKTNQFAHYTQNENALTFWI